MTLATRIGVMNHGEIVQIGTPRQIYEFPPTRFVADFIGSVNLFDGKLHARTSRTTCACSAPSCRRRCWSITASARRRTRRCGWRCGRRRSCCRASRRADADNWAQGVIREIAYLGDLSVFLVRLESGREVRATLANSSRKPEEQFTREHAGVSQLGRLQSRRRQRLRPAHAASSCEQLAASTRLGRAGGRAAVPLLWLLLFFLVPFLIVLKISFSEGAAGDAAVRAAARVDARDACCRSSCTWRTITSCSPTRCTWIRSSIRSRWLRSRRCCACCSGYPMALGIARAPPARRNLLLMLVILPFWTSFLLRVYAWIGLLKDDGLINNVLLALHLIHSPIPMVNTTFAVYVGIVYSYLPFMILPLYANLEKHDATLLEAAADLGAPPWKAFLRVTWPLSMPGVIAGALLVFIPAVGEYVIPSLLGPANQLMIGRVLSDEFFENRDWPVASAVAIVILIVLLGADHDLPALPAAASWRPARELRRRALLVPTMLAFGFAFLYVPILSMIVYSFNASRLVTVWDAAHSPTLKWYGALFNNGQIMDAALAVAEDRRHECHRRGDPGHAWPASRWRASAAFAAAACSPR